MANFHHNNRNHSYRGRGRKNQNVESRYNKEVRENKERHDQQEARAMYRERRERENKEREVRDNREPRDNRESREQREPRENRERRERRENRELRDNQTITTFILGEKEIEGKSARFQYDKGWYSITDVIGEDKNVIYKSKNAQEAYTKWNVYIGRKKERPQRVEKTEN